MVWVPHRKERAEIRRRLAELANPPKTAKGTSLNKRSAAAKLSSNNATSTVSRANGQSTGATTMQRKQSDESCPSAQPAAKINNVMRERNNDEALTTHHIPPRNAQPYTRKRVTRKVHQAYHTIFGPSPTFEACVAILRRDWWPNTPSTSAEES